MESISNPVLPKQETPVTESTPTPPVVPEPEKKASKVNLIIPIVIFVVLALVIAGFFFAYQKGYFNQFLKEEDTNNEEIEEEQPLDSMEIEEYGEDEEEIPQEVYFEGDTVRALQPAGWTIEEYYDGEGTESLVEGTTYEGLTGLKIKKNGVEKFSIRAVSGIGFVGCPMYAQFADYNPSHLALQESMAEEIGEPMNITDYSDSEYEEFEWLGKTFRRIGETYFYDEEEGNNYFEAPCVSGLLVLEGFTFMDSNGYLGEAYFYGAAEGTSEEDLLLIDSILESMVLQE